MNSDLEVVPTGNLTSTDVQTCLSLIQAGSAVDIDWVREYFPQAILVAIKRDKGEIVAVGVIKPKRPNYASHVALKSGFAFDENLHEVGYVSVRLSHRGRRFSQDILQGLLSAFPDHPLFATTSHPAMKDVLGDVGFAQKGGEWIGNRSDLLSLWIRGES